ncbi:tRNA threonylcarbamoyladenosine dehydratase [Caproiciproducens galactitolivorans]|uniref:tRNA threonylcarbamoyladenosine dehydratase n=1 Tax=Caproiciproducens galactitolivorans TaxID=642589 RepID=A0A4Z0XZJ1_9FIRM|nr:tRNA threonylcarbamoyladenosine dehydratase [Caproiciproducens galactitolivorans]QEY34783.1 tRNA threonylcarbamoyladenosine dehydratase [Caproiciproducens galactitolivorans]TGJ75967.1 tRNA threonylcarbamoyladenosine dehydratase [Caproiciproducens galactitolivorans]
MLNEFSRAELLFGAAAMQKLHEAAVAVFGIGGVGSYTVEALARGGVGHIALIDDDKVCLTNINRQLIATRKTIGKLKVEVMRDRILDINPNAQVEIYPIFYTAETADELDLTGFSYIVDAIDTISSKLVLIERAKAAGVPIISCMGAGNKLDPTKFEVADIYQTSVCPLARVMRTELRKRKVESLKVVYSKEPPLPPIESESSSCKNYCVCPPGTKRKCSIRRQVPGSSSFVPPVAGMILAGEVIKDIIK